MPVEFSREIAVSQACPKNNEQVTGKQIQSKMSNPGTRYLVFSAGITSQRAGSSVVLTGRIKGDELALKLLKYRFRGCQHHGLAEWRTTQSSNPSTGLSGDE